MKEECRLRVFENRVLRRILGSGENYITKSLIICIPHPLLFG
jgi:hypothetical protein